jgi:hypothetical protein
MFMNNKKKKIKFVLVKYLISESSNTNAPTILI